MPAYFVQMADDVLSKVEGVNACVVFAADTTEAVEVAKKAVHPNDQANHWDGATVTALAAGNYDWSEFEVVIGDAPNATTYTYTAAVSDTVDLIGAGIQALLVTDYATCTYTGATQILDFPSGENLGQTTITSRWHKFGGQRKVETLTFSDAVVAGDTILITVDGVEISEAFDTNSNTTLANLATSIQGEAGVTTCTVTDAGGGNDDDRVLTVTSLTPGSPAILQDYRVTGNGGVPSITAKITTPNLDPIDGTDYANLQPTVNAEGGSPGVQRTITLVADATAVPAIVGRVAAK